MLWLEKILNNHFSNLSLNGSDTEFFLSFLLFICLPKQAVLAFKLTVLFILFVALLKKSLSSIFLNLCIQLTLVSLYVLVTVLSKSVINFTAWNTFISHAIFYLFPSSVFYYLCYLNKELGLLCWVKNILNCHFSSSVTEDIFYYRYCWAHPELEMDDAARREHSRIPLHFWLNLAKLFLLPPGIFLPCE